MRINPFEWAAALIRKGYSVPDALKKAGEMAIPDFFLEVSKGNVAGHTALVKFGLNGDVNGTEEDLWSNGGSLSYLTSAETMEIASTSAADDLVGVGARKVVIQGLDANYAEISETVEMDGTTNVQTAKSYLRVHRMYVTEVGTDGDNAGAITATATTAGTVQAHIPAALGQTQQVIYTVPAGKYAYVVGEAFSVVKGAGGGGPGGGTAGIHFYGWVRTYNEDSTNNYDSWRSIFDIQVIEAGGNPAKISEDTYQGLSPKTDIRVSVESDTSNMEVNGRLYIILVDEDLVTP